MSERDPIEALREQWATLDSPGPHADDARTEASVAWLRAAWDTLEAPGARAVLPQPRRAPGLWPLALAAAAGWLALLLLVVPRGGDYGPELAQLAPQAAPEAALPPVHARYRGDGGIELRSGVVKLVLVGAPPEPVVGDEADANDPTDPTDPIEEPGENR